MIYYGGYSGEFDHLDYYADGGDSVKYDTSNRIDGGNAFTGGTSLQKTYN